MGKRPNILHELHGVRPRPSREGDPSLGTRGEFQMLDRRCLMAGFTAVPVCGEPALANETCYSRSIWPIARVIIE